MPNYPQNHKEALQRASAIARKFGNLECDRCAREIVQALGPHLGVKLVKLVSRDTDVIGLASRDIQVSKTGIHVGVQIGDRIVDNHHAEGILAREWRRQFVAGWNKPLIARTTPAADFFGTRFLRKRFDQFVSASE